MRINTNSKGLSSRAVFPDIVSPGTKPCSHLPGGSTAFTIIEVMIAMGIFFMAIFAILSLVSSNLRIARRLQEPQVDAGMLVSQLSLTNQLQEGGDSGNFGDVYPGYKWESTITQVGTNGLFQVEYLVTGPAVRG